MFYWKTAVYVYRALVFMDLILGTAKFFLPINHIENCESVAKPTLNTFRHK